MEHERATEHHRAAAVNPPNHDQFHVVLHGAIALVDTGTAIVAHLVDMGTDHNYLAGSWLAESQIPMYFQATLDGSQLAQGKKGLLDGSKNPVVKGVKLPSPNSTDIHAVFTFPLPTKISYSNRVAIKLDDPQGILKGKAVSLAEARVLSYDLQPNGDYSKIALSQAFTAGTAPWNAAPPTVFPKGHVSVLHIFNSPLKDPDQNHITDEFDKGAALLGAASVRIVPGSSTGQPYPKDDDRPDGMLAQETEDLRDRHGAIQSMVDALRTAMPFSLPSRRIFLNQCEGCCSSVDGEL
jgi:hypothetical protein